MIGSWVVYKEFPLFWLKGMPLLLPFAVCWCLGAASAWTLLCNCALLALVARGHLLSRPHGQKRLRRRWQQAAARKQAEAEAAPVDSSWLYTYADMGVRAQERLVRARKARHLTRGLRPVFIESKGAYAPA